MQSILIANPGSTATKYKRFQLDGELVEERIFLLSEREAEEAFLQSLRDEITKIGIRVVHGGDTTTTTRISEDLKELIRTFLPFAPIHNARALTTIALLEEHFPATPLYASFDTAFHTSIPAEHAYYMIDRDVAEQYGIKKYGFHGLAVQSAIEIVREQYEQKGDALPQRIIVAHLGGGCSVTAVQNGKSFITSMELTPLSGIPMITRSGNVDPDIFSVLAKKAQMSVEEISQLLNQKSGFYGMTGTKDTLAIIQAAQAGEVKEKLAFDIFVHALVQKIFAYAGLMGGLDALVFSGGIGYGNAYLRETVQKKLSLLKIERERIYPVSVDEEKVIFRAIQSL